MKKPGRIINLESFRSGKSRIGEYVNIKRVKYFRNQEVEFNQSLFESINNRRFGIGLYGDKTDEPHLILLNHIDEYLSIINKFGLDRRINSKAILKNLRYLASVFGNYFTFNKRLFPLGINFDIGLIKDGVIYMATHGRNLSSSKGMCRYQQIMTGYCKCLISVSDTGGAVMAYFANNLNDAKAKKIKTVHRGGEIMYVVSEGEDVNIDELYTLSLARPRSRRNVSNGTT